MYHQNHQTERLLIRLLTAEDAIIWEKFFEYPECIQYLPAQPDKTNFEKARFWMDKQLTRYKENRFGLMGLIEKTTGNFVGQCGLLTQELDGEPVLEIGYHLLPEYWGKGYATEAAVFFKTLAFKNNYARELVSIIDVGNQASQRVAARHGMKKTKNTLFWGLEVEVFSIHVTG
jgi:RimJ/RimL family protein N-acetyltransferase